MGCTENTQWTGRTARHISLVVGAVIILSIVGIVSIGGLLYLLANYKDIISPIAIFVIIIAVLLTLASVAHSLIGLVIANDNIFCASGKPIEMAKTLYENFFLQAQIILAILVVSLMSVLMIFKILDVSQALPVITGAVGFALGRQFDKSNIKLEKENNEKR